LAYVVNMPIIVICKILSFDLRLHQNAFGSQGSAGPTGGAYSWILRVGVGKGGEGKGGGKGRKGKGKGRRRDGTTPNKKAG